MIRKFFTLIGSLILIVLIVFIALPFLVPIESYKDDVLQLVEDKTGRKIKIDGDMSFTMLPDIAIQLNKVKVDNGEGFISPHFANIGTLDLKVALWPLLEKKVEINELSVNGGEFFIEEAVGGKKNWEFKIANDSKKSEMKQKEGAKSDKAKFTFDVDRIDIKNTKVNYLAKGQKFSSEALNLDYSNNRSKLDVILNHAGTKYRIDFTTSDTQSLFGERKTPLKLKLRSPLVRADIQGELAGVNLGKGVVNPALSGAMNANITGIGKLNSREFSANKKNANLGLLSIETQLGVSGTGEMKVNYAGRKPKITTTLSIPKLNLDALEKGKQASLLFIKNAYAADAWSRKPISFAALGKVNADADLSVGELLTSGYRFTDFKTKLGLTNGKLKIRNYSGAILGGNVSGSGNANINGSWDIKAKISNMPFENLATQFTQKVAITGNTTANLSFRSNGKSMHDYMNRLSGGGSITIGKGSVSGFSLPSLFRKTAAATAGVVESKNGLSTPFNSINITFSADRGVLRLREGKLRGDRLKADAAGKINLGAKSLDLVLTPETIPAPVKEGETEKQYKGLMVPVTVKGSFDNVKVKPDYSRTIGNLFKDALKGKEGRKGLKQQGKAIEDAFEPSKDAIKKNIKEFEDTKDPTKIFNIIDELDKSGLNPLGDIAPLKDIAPIKDLAPLQDLLKPKK